MTTAATTKNTTDRPIPVFRYDPRQEGLDRWFGSLEAEIMEVVWATTRPVPVRDVFRKIVADREIAYTTIMTTMVRLYEKGVLLRSASEGAYLYWPICDQVAFENAQAKYITDSL